MNKSTKLEGNWYEERYYHADTRTDEAPSRIRPREDDIENLPRIKRIVHQDAPVFKPDDDDIPQEKYLTETKRAFQPITTKEVTTTEKRMRASPQYVQDILSVKPDKKIPNYGLKPVPPQEQFMTETRSKFKQYF